MGKRGPAPKPTALKIREGNPGKRPIPQDEPKPPPASGEIPDWLPEAAKAHWSELFPVLTRMGVMTSADTDALALYCHTYARWRACVDFLDALPPNGHFYAIREKATVDPKTQEVKEGRVKMWMPLPQISLERNLSATLVKLLNEFGMTPSSRSRISADNNGLPQGEGVVARLLREHSSGAN